MLLGYKNRKTNLPTPIYYHYFAYTAAALIAGDRKKMTWRSIPENTLLKADDVIACIDKHGIYGAYDEADLGVSVEPFKKHKALFARMFNIDHRFGRVSINNVRMENFILAVDNEARFPAPGYCPHCHAIDMWWENKTYKQSMTGEDYLKWQELMDAYGFLSKRKPPFTGTPDNSEFLHSMFDVETESAKYKNHYKLTLEDIGEFNG